MLLFGTESHNLFDPGTVIPRTVKEYDFPGRRQVRYITLEIPLPPFALRRDSQRDDPRGTGIQVFHETLYGTALARRVTALKDHYYTLARILDPVLQLQQFNLEHALQVIVFLTGHPLGVGIVFAPGVHLAPVSVTKHRVVLVGIIHPHARRDHVRAIWPVRARVTCAGLPSVSHIQPHPAPDHATSGISGPVRRYHAPQQDSSGIHRLGALPHSAVRAAGPVVLSGASALFSYASNYTVIRIELERIGNLRSRDAWNRRRGRRLGPFPPCSYLGDAASRPAAGCTDSPSGPPGPGPPGHRHLLGSTYLP